MKTYAIHNPQNELFMLAGQPIGNTIEMSWIEEVSFIIDIDDLGSFLNRGYTFIDRSDKLHPVECTPEEISKWIVILWDDEEFELDPRESFTVKEFLSSNK